MFSSNRVGYGQLIILIFSPSDYYPISEQNAAILSTI